MSDFNMTFDGGEEMNMGFKELQFEAPTNHNDLTGRDASSCHPISAINQLAETLQSHLDAIALKVNQTYVDSEIARVEAEIPSLDGYATETYVDTHISSHHDDTKADLENGKIPSSQLPSYVDDVIEVASYSELPATGESGKIYITQDTNKTYRWAGNGYAEISPSLALGETSATAYRGDRGKIAYDLAQAHDTDIAGIKEDISQLESGKQDKATTGTFTLAVASWVNKEQAVNVSGVTASNHIFPNPTNASEEDWGKCGIWCASQGNGTLTFTCKTVPTVAINGQVVIL